MRLIHRDLKPTNVMFRADGALALVDFGSASYEIDPVASTVIGSVIGTPLYLSPEQSLGEKADARSDLYAVGALAYELLAGQRMYAPESLQLLFEMHRGAPIRQLPEAAARHQQFFARLVAKRPDDRFADAQTALDALLAIG